MHKCLKTNLIYISLLCSRIFYTQHMHLVNLFLDVVETGLLFHYVVLKMWVVLVL